MTIYCFTGPYFVVSQPDYVLFTGIDDNKEISVILSEYSVINFNDVEELKKSGCLIIGCPITANIIIKAEQK